MRVVVKQAGSAVVMLRLSRPTACGIVVPGLGIKPLFPALAGRFLTPGHQGSFERKAFLNSSRKTEISGAILR